MHAQDKHVKIAMQNVKNVLVHCVQTVQSQDISAKDAKFKSVGHVLNNAMHAREDAVQIALILKQLVGLVISKLVRVVQHNVRNAKNNYVSYALTK
ncbi:MAG: hypothetical protein EZS28_048361 [Streblomastix strix]|uniref:Uncharacterized protein n=1 Tax=Streblomastix strix TaxID=222440 RepID=A0A5J4TDS3_9EUKA|nr:MAG: hypothetical protein EZS28_048361 [Streblomastix strix]